MANEDGTSSRIPEKEYFKIREVSRIAGVESHVLRFWETEFKQIRPGRTPSGQRLYRRRDINVILEIKHLLYEQKFTIQGARQHLEAEGKPPAWEELAPVLEEIQTALAEIRDLLQ